LIAGLVAEWWLCPSTTHVKVSRHPQICHPDRSVAQRRDLLFLSWFSHGIVILSEAPQRLIA